MSQALPEVILSAEPEHCDTSKEHLNPADNWHQLPNGAMALDKEWTNASMNSSLQVQFKIYAQPDLYDQHERKGGRKGSMNVRRKLAAFVHMAQEVSKDCDHSTSSLEGNVPSRADYLRCCQHDTIICRAKSALPPIPSLWGISGQTRQFEEGYGSKEQHPKAQVSGGEPESRHDKRTIGSFDMTWPSGILSLWPPWARAHPARLMDNTAANFRDFMVPEGDQEHSSRRFGGQNRGSGAESTDMRAWG